MRKLVIMIFLFVIPLSFYAQDRLSGQKGSVVGLKTNIPYWGAMATFNAGVEFRLARHWSLDIETGLNPFDGKKEDGSYGKSLKHWRLHPELRYWFCETSYKHFIGLHVPYILYNVSDIKILGTENERHQGWGAGVGVTVIHGCFPSIGIWKRRSVWDISILNRRNTPVQTVVVVRNTSRNITSVQHRLQLT